MAFGTSKMRTWPLARAIMLITTVAAGAIIIGILLVLLGANRQNMLVDKVLDLGGWFARPFHDLFPQTNPKQNIFVNWGIAAIAYFLAGGALARLVR